MYMIIIVKNYRETIEAGKVERLFVRSRKAKSFYEQCNQIWYLIFFAFFFSLYSSPSLFPVLFCLFAILSFRPFYHPLILVELKLCNCLNRKLIKNYKF